MPGLPLRIGSLYTTWVVLFHWFHHLKENFPEWVNYGLVGSESKELVLLTQVSSANSANFSFGFNCTNVNWLSPRWLTKKPLITGSGPFVCCELNWGESGIRTGQITWWRELTEKDKVLTLAVVVDIFLNYDAVFSDVASCHVLQVKANCHGRVRCFD